MDQIAPQSPLSYARRGWRRRGGPWAVAGALLVVILAASWLVVPYLLDGRAMLDQAGTTLRKEQLGQASALARALVRVADGAGEAEIDVLWAVPEYFSAADAGGTARDLEPDHFHVFLVTETTHVNPLPRALPAATLFVDGEPTVVAAEVTGPDSVEHHRTSVVRVPHTAPDGAPTIPPSAHWIELRLTGDWAGTPTVREADWDVPLDLPMGGKSYTPALVLAVAAGLLAAVLTPCLLQMLVIYLSVLAGLGAAEGGASPRRAVALMALAFAGGFTLLYTGAGALVGHLGNGAQVLFASVGWPVSIAAGVLILGLALWTAVRARMPVVCHLPLPGALKGADRRGLLRAALLSSAVAVGCLTCFSGAIVGTLLLYVGVLGSATIGALVMLMFSLGVAVPFLAAALALSRMRTLTDFLARHARALAAVNVAVMAGYGAILITDNFHVVSDLIYPWLRLG